MVVVPDPSKILFSTAFKYFLNYTTVEGSVNVPSTSYATGEAKSYSVTVPITRTQDFSQVRINYSHLSANWYNFPPGQIVLDANFTISTVGSYTGSNLTITFYVVNQVIGPVSNTAFTATVKSFLFVVPE